jgi:effector-binding domain-containing protein
MPKQAKQHTLKLTDNQLRKLTRLVGNYTAGDERDLYNLYSKLCTLHKSLGDEPGGYGRVSTWQSPTKPIIRFDTE